ncbi:uncharacterized protein LOC126827180 [Patella vulgata]|uniref:uncharacterized protein LOC126827180 n=1 Tax=Patella vulgata TaxID=6465 RepID=UPI0021807861|nr:uncharacterized protein LOC126827180 [Patella vulgata]
MLHLCLYLTSYLSCYLCGDWTGNNIQLHNLFMFCFSNAFFVLIYGISVLAVKGTSCKMSRYKEMVLIVQGIIWISGIILASGTCPARVWKKIPLAGKLFSGITSETAVLSVKGCAEKCTEAVNCKSFGFNTASKKCYLYDVLIWAGGLSADEADVVYYWALKDRCPTNLGYTQDSSGSTCAKLFSDVKTWEDAMKECDQHDGHLFLVDAPFKKDLILNLTQNSSSTYTYLGATDGNIEGDWKWLNGVTIPIASPSEWIPGRPDNYGNSQHCMAFKKESGSSGLDDRDCADPSPFICEIPMNEG